MAKYKKGSKAARDHMAYLRSLKTAGGSKKTKRGANRPIAKKSSDMAKYAKWVNDTYDYDAADLQGTRLPVDMAREMFRQYEEFYPKHATMDAARTSKKQAKDMRWALNPRAYDYPNVDTKDGWYRVGYQKNNKKWPKLKGLDSALDSGLEPGLWERKNNSAFWEQQLPRQKSKRQQQTPRSKQQKRQAGNPFEQRAGNPFGEQNPFDEPMNSFDESSDEPVNFCGPFRRKRERQTGQTGADYLAAKYPFDSVSLRVNPTLDLNAFNPKDFRHVWKVIDNDIKNFIRNSGFDYNDLPTDLIDELMWQLAPFMEQHAIETSMIGKIASYIQNAGNRYKYLPFWIELQKYYEDYINSLHEKQD